jgi:hypothetical protein
MFYLLSTVRNLVTLRVCSEDLLSTARILVNVSVSSEELLSTVRIFVTLCICSEEERLMLCVVIIKSKKLRYCSCIFDAVLWTTTLIMQCYGVRH